MLLFSRSASSLISALVSLRNQPRFGKAASLCRLGFVICITLMVGQFAVAQAQVAATPVISLASGAYPNAQTVTITDSTPGATIYYTTNGVYPSIFTTAYSGAITVSGSEVVAAVAVAPAYTNSNIAVAHYLIGSSSSPLIYTIAGNQTPGYTGDGGAATFAEMGNVAAVAIDGAGDVYLADMSFNVVRKVAAGTGIISTVAGTGAAGHTGDGGPATSAKLWQPSTLAVDAAGNLYIGELGDSEVRRVDAGTGTITTFAGNPNGTGNIGGPAINYPLQSVAGLSLDHLGNLFVADAFDVYEINPSTGNIAEIAGLATGANFGILAGIVVDSNENVYVSDSLYNLVKKINPQGAISVFAGRQNGFGGNSGDGGPATNAYLGSPSGLAIDGSGNLYVADRTDYTIRQVNANGVINSVAGIFGFQTNYGVDGDNALDVALDYPTAIATDASGNIYFADGFNNRVRKITAAALPPSATTLTPVFSLAAGSYTGSQTLTMTDATPGAEIYVSLNGNAPTPANEGYHGPINITGTVTVQAIALAPGSLASAPATAKYAISTPPSAVISTVAGTPGYNGFSGMGGAARSAALGSPQAVAIDGSGNLYIADPSNSVVWMVAAGSGNISIAAGTGASGSAVDGGLATASALRQPCGVAFDKAGNLYIADAGTNRIRRVSAQTGIITTIAGPGINGTLGDGGPATSANLYSPYGISFDSAGNLYIADVGNGRIRMIASQTGIISTVAGGGTSGLGDGGPAAAASLRPYDVAVDSAGNLYIPDNQNARIRKVTAATGVISTIAGNGIFGNSGDGGLATQAEIYPIQGIALDGSGNVYFSNYPDTIRRVDATTGILTTVAGDGYFGYGGDGGAASMAELYDPLGLALDGSGNVYIGDYFNFAVRKVTFPGPAPTPTFSPVAGTYVGARTVTITDAQQGAAIYYTTDGSTPTTGSNLYNGAITVSASETLQAIAVVTGYTESAVASAAYVINQPVTPTITWPAPAAITYGTALSATQLNATASVPGTFAYSPAIGAVLAAGSQTLSVTFTPTDNVDYTTATATVTLTVGVATPTITWATPAAITYGTALGATQLNATASTPGTFVYTPAAGVVLAPGTQTLATVFTPTDATDYSTAKASVTLTVNKAAPTIALTSSSNPALVSNPVTFTAMLASSAGTPTGTVSFYDGTTLLGPGTLSAGSATYNTSSLTAGAHAITASYSGDANFATATSAALTETMEDFTIGTSGGGSGTTLSASTTPGGQATYTIAIDPPTGTTFPTPVTLAVSGLPAGATATFNPASIAAGSGATNVTMTVTVPSTAAARPIGNPFGTGAMPIALGLILLPFAGRLRKASRRLHRLGGMMLLGMVGISVALGLAGCGGSSKSTPAPQNYTLTITATAGSLSHTITATLTVQ